MSQVEIWGNTDRGLVRTNNEDALFFDPGLPLAIVADGMGGAACGEIASHITVDIVADRFRNRDSREMRTVLEEAIREANSQVLERARSEVSCKGMGSTIVAVCWDLPRIGIANVGDSRAYLFHEGKLQQLSHDQTLVNELRLRMGLTQEQVNNFPHKNVLTMAIGSTGDLVVWNRETEIAEGDLLLLCSDGLTGPVSDGRIEAILGEDGSLREKVDTLIDAAKESGAPDNVTVVLIRWVPPLS